MAVQANVEENTVIHSIRGFGANRNFLLVMNYQTFDEKFLMVH